MKFFSILIMAIFVYMFRTIFQGKLEVKKSFRSFQRSNFFIYNLKSMKLINEFLLFMF